MGGANSKDPGKLDYEKHNIYLNNARTYGRLAPVRPITLHQKALFCFWLSIIWLWIVLKLSNLIRKFGSTNKMKDEEKGTADNSHIGKNAAQDDNEKSAAASISRFGRGDATEESKEARSLFSHLTEHAPDQPPFQDFLLKAIIFGFIMLYFWLCDYQHIWPKTEKQYSRDIFVFLFSLLVLVALVYTIRKTPEKLLNRDQTEEWKGWMQVQFVWYHYYDAQEAFNSIRCYIAAYVWMTGFGNFSYFWIRKDYSIFRLLKMMFRLNFLVVMVMAVTNHEFVRYYICAMHTYWFLSVYCMMAVLKSKNQDRKIMAAKFVVYFVINALIFEVPGAPYKVFWPFQFILNVGGTLRYWVFRSTLDHWVTWVGMLCAYNYPYVERFLNHLDSKHDDYRKRREVLFLKAAITLACCLVFLLWFKFALIQPKEHYMLIHPYFSSVPILVYIWLRNCFPILRTRYLNLFAWLGKITLETYLSQIHIYMIGDAKKLLVYVPGYPMMNFLLATAIYVIISYVLFHQTLFFNSYILPKNMTIIGRNFVVGIVWLGLSYLLSFGLTKASLW